MVRKSAGHSTKDMSISTTGKPTEKTGVPQPNMGHKGGLMDGIVRGVERGVHTRLVDGLISNASSHKASDGMHSIRPSATKMATQQFGSVAYADAKLGRG